MINYNRQAVIGVFLWVLSSIISYAYEFNWWVGTLFLISIFLVLFKKNSELGLYKKTVKVMLNMSCLVLGHVVGRVLNENIGLQYFFNLFFKDLKVLVLSGFILFFVFLLNYESKARL